MCNIVLVRSPEILTQDSLIGYGWSQINFSSFKSFGELLSYVKENSINIGRQKNQMSRYFNIQQGDIIVQPVNRGIYVGIANGIKSFGEGVVYGDNRIFVDFFKDEHGKAIKIPRSRLKQQLQSRLKIRMSIASLNEFREEIEGIVSQLKNNKDVLFNSEFQLKSDEAIDNFKRQLLKNITTGNTFLEGGGYGLEKLVLELMSIEGYKASISAKNQFSTIADTDIEASRIDPVSSNKVYIQVKHHSGNTGSKGIEQLIAIEEDEHVDKWLISSGNFTDTVKEKAEAQMPAIKLMNGSDLVDWVYDRIRELSPATKEKLGISFVPQLLI